MTKYNTGKTVVINNRGTLAIASVVRSYTVAGVVYTDIKTEYGSLIEGITTNNTMPVFIKTGSFVSMETNLPPQANVNINDVELDITMINPIEKNIILNT